MTYISFDFYIFLAILLIVYYSIPFQVRWIAILAGSVLFYYKICEKGIWILLLTIVLSYFAGLLTAYFCQNNKIRKLIVCSFSIILAFVWFVLKGGFNTASSTWIVPVGISFYTLQIISYLIDIYKGKISPQRNILKYALYVFFFPQIIQGPIPRYQQLASQLYQGHPFQEERFVRGMQLILWGFFLKLMIADKAAVIVNEIFTKWEIYKGFYFWTAGILYSIELYTDFLACVTISQGVAGLFGVALADNFRRPYFAVSIKDFWRRWHISFSGWLRDYIYIPLGGNRKGTFAKYINLVITFAVSGVWHGNGLQFLVWGLLHAFYQIVGALTNKVRIKLYDIVSLSERSGMRIIIQRISIFFWVTIAWVIFRAESLEIGLYIIKSMFSVFNPWIFFNDALLKLGLDWKEWCVLLLSISVLIGIHSKQEKGVCIGDFINSRSAYMRWIIYIAAIICIMVFGTYGFGYNAQDFIYGGF